MSEEEAVYPFKTQAYYAWCGGRSYMVCQDGDVLTARERGVRLGEVRMFFYFNSGEEQCMYFAERQFKSILHPFRAPKIWWRKVI